MYLDSVSMNLMFYQVMVICLHGLSQKRIKMKQSDISITDHHPIHIRIHMCNKAKLEQYLTSNNIKLYTFD